MPRLIRQRRPVDTIRVRVRPPKSQTKRGFRQDVRLANKKTLANPPKRELETVERRLQELPSLRKAAR